MLYTPPVAASEMHNYSKEIRHCVLSACCDDRTKMLETRSYPEFLITRRIRRYRKRPSLTHFATLTSWDFESWIYRDASSINLVSIGMIGKADFLQITIIPIFFSAKGKKKKEHFDNLHVCISNFSRGKLVSISTRQSFFPSFTERSVIPLSPKWNNYCDNSGS